MNWDILPNPEVVDRISLSIAVMVGLIILFWVSIQANSPTVVVNVVRAGAGTTLLIIVLGGLLARLFDVPTHPLGRFGLYVVGLSLATLAALTTAMSLLLPLVGIRNPFSVIPLTVAVSALLFGLLFAVYRTDTSLADTPFNYPRASPLRSLQPLPFVALLCLLPVFAVVGAVLMNRFAVNTGMFVAISAIVVVVVLAATRCVPSRLYPAVVFSVALSTLLHHNLLSQHIIGADIQGLYFAADLLTQLHQWPPMADGTAVAIPVVTTVPASFSMLTGIDLTITYTTVYVLLFAFVPLGVFYVSREVFDDVIALFASFFFVFYHITFIFTPGKQLMSELFAVLLVLVIVRDDFHGYGRNAAILLLSIGLIGSHYGTTFLFGSALLFAAVVLFAVNRLVDEVTPRLPVWYPVALLAGASAWYAFISPELFARIVSVPMSIPGQILLLLSGETIEASGASYVGQQTSLLSTLNLALYGLLTVFICIGMGWRSLTTLLAFRRGEVPDDAGYTALAVPILAFLASSYFFVFNLWAARVYQMTLVFLAPFMPLGYRYIGMAVSAVSERLPSLRSTAKRADGGTEQDNPSESQRSMPKREVWWSVLAVVLGTLLIFNSGMVFALAGTAENSAFNANANDLVFSHKEVQGVKWLKTHADNLYLMPNHSSMTNHSSMVRVYADPRSAQLLRSVLSESYYNVNIIRLKSKWHLHLHPDQLNEGYVVIRQASIVTAQQANGSSTLISKRDVQKITARGIVVFRNEDILIVKLETNTSAKGVTPMKSKQVIRPKRRTGGIEYREI